MQPPEDTVTQSNDESMEPLKQVVSRREQDDSLPDPDVVLIRSQQHYREVYRDFLRAKERLGESIEKINFERFTS